MWVNLVMLRSAIWALLALSGKGMGTMLPRAFQTNATCSPMNGESWVWMDNMQHQSPCLTAAFIIGPCVSSNYNVPPLDSTDRYSFNETTVNRCSCSWAAYNLFSACTLCQGFQDSVASWVAWSEDCGNFISNAQPYPSNIPIPQGVTFPNWAAKNPTSWPEGRFDGDAAHEYEMANPGDWNISNKGGNKGRKIGAIVGGVVGGVVVLGVGIAAALFLNRRNKRQLKVEQAESMRQTMIVPLDHHPRNPSDFSGRMGLMYNPLGSSSPSSGLDSRFLSSPGTLYTHNSSRNSLPESLIPSHASLPTSQVNVLEAVSNTGTPFTSQISSSQDVHTSAHSRKMSEASTQLDGSNGSRGPMNPPAYQSGPSVLMTPQNQNSSGLSNWERQSLSGTVISQSTNMSMGSTFWSHDGPTSLDGAAELISHMNTPALFEAVPAYSGPEPSTVVPRDEKRRPTIMNQE